MNIDNTVEPISRILAEKLTGTKITEMFRYLNLEDFDKNRGYTSSKWARINESIRESSNIKESLIKVIEYVCKPQNFINLNSSEWNVLLSSINGTLMFYGLEINDSGKVTYVKKVDTYNDGKRRLKSLNNRLNEYNIHHDVLKYCIDEYLENDYFGVIFEASKGLCERIRKLSGLSFDGIELINTAFNFKNPLIVIKNNKLNTLTERNEYNGLISLLKSIHYLYRNSKVHNLRILDYTSEDDAINALVVMSTANRELDKCVFTRDTTF